MIKAIRFLAWIWFIVIGGVLLLIPDRAPECIVCNPRLNNNVVAGISLVLGAIGLFSEFRKQGPSPFGQ